VKPVDPRIRFRDARERVGLSHDQVAAQSGLPIGAPAIWDIETHEGDLENYSPAEIRNFCCLLGISPAELFGERFSERPVSADELVKLIRQECVSRGLTLAQFEDVVGWRLSACIDPPERLIEDISIDGLQWLCRELRIDWRRAL
jgi:hypothetical protein